MLFCFYMYINTNNYDRVWPSVKVVLSLSTEIGLISNYTVWLGAPLQVKFSLSNNCGDYHLYFPNRTMVDIINKSFQPLNSSVEEVATFTIQSVTREYNNITMCIRATNAPVFQTFFIYTQGMDKFAHISIAIHCLLMHIHVMHIHTY